MNIEKSELDPKQVFDFVGYLFDVMPGNRTFNKNTGTSIPTALSGPAIHVCYIYGHYISAFFNLRFMSIYCHMQ